MTHSTCAVSLHSQSSSLQSIGQTVDLPTLAAQLDFVVADAVFPELYATSKEAAIQALVDRLVETGAVPAVQRDDVLAAVLHREAVGSTAVGSGVAIPHTKHHAVRNVVAAVAFCPNGICFGSRDGLAVQLIILLVSPEHGHAAHLEALSLLSQHLLAATRTPSHHAVAV
jgi:PTS system fructose-specific IIA component/PTS system nitrogen regulatory IIA component